jgi:hypothetical protein
METDLSNAPLDLPALPKTYLLDDVRAAAVLDISPGTLSVWRSTGRYNLKYRKIGRKVRYAVGDLLDFLESRAMQHTSKEVR